MPNLFPDTQDRSAFPQGPADRASGLYGTGAPFGRVAPGAIAEDDVPEDFAAYFQLVLWNEGVDVSMQAPDTYMAVLRTLWEDQYIQDLYQTAYIGSSGSDPLTGAMVTDADFESAIRYELFDPTRTHSMVMLPQGLRLHQAVR